MPFYKCNKLKNKMFVFNQYLRLYILGAYMYRCKKGFLVPKNLLHMMHILHYVVIFVNKLLYELDLSIKFI